MWNLFFLLFKKKILAYGCRDGNVSPPLWSRLKYLYNYWMDCHEIWYRYPWFP